MLKHYALLVVALFGFVSESQAAKPFTYNSLNDGPSVLTATQVPQPAAETAPAQEAAVVEARPDAPVTREVPASDVPPAPVESAPAPAAPAPVAEQPVVQTPMPVASPAVEGEAAATEPVVVDSAVSGQSAPVMQSAPVYRSARGYRPMYGGVLGELIELERRKNAWIRRNVFGR